MLIKKSLTVGKQEEKAAHDVRDVVLSLNSTIVDMCGSVADRLENVKYSYVIIPVFV
jgi:hypothetical protein